MARFALLIAVLVGLGEVMRRVFPSASPADAPVEAPTLARPAEADTEALMDAVLHATQDASLADLAPLLDEVALERAAFRGLPSRAVGRARFDFRMADVAQSLLIGPMAEGGRVARLPDRVADAEEDRVWARLRLLRPSGAVDHISLAVARHEGRTAIVDLRTWTMAGPLTEVLREQVAPAVVAGGWDPARVMRRRRVAAFLDAPTAEASFDAFAALDPEDQDVVMHLVRIDRAPPDAGSPLRRQALADLVARFPDHPAARVHAVELAHLDGHHAAAAAFLDGLQATEGPDAYLHVLAAFEHQHAGDLADARLALDRAAALEPTLSDVPLARLVVALSEGDDAEAAALIRELDQAWGIDLAAELDLD